MAKTDPRKWIPKGRFKDYYLFWYSNIPENCTSGAVGEIGNSSDPKTKVVIILDDQEMKTRRQRGNCLVIGKNYYESSVILIDQDYYDICKSGELNSFFGFWHEIGHYHTLHYFPDYALNMSSLRRRYIEQAKIAPAEYVADLFGLYYSGEENTLAEFRKRLRDRHKQMRFGDDNALLAWHELRQRRQALIDLHDDETLIVNEIMRICGVDLEEEI